MTITDIPGVNQLLQQLVKKSEIEQIILFGSRARGDNEERSDIDLAIAAPNVTLHQWFDIMDLVEEADTLYSFDIIRYEEVSSTLKDRIAIEGKVLFRRGAKSDNKPIR
ncbi:nucleotidyltransferase domain-containing protein [Heliobacterium gestii]|uniref:Nucleotidyltransferase domain-containing protein n=1 Tax=Heliomicrobium gestii TaxID=2699 RepID=A0A845L7T4_HELGE|nr:nucleotidyltransferase domain-containing protein [Heliomicrobium gestii]MBM7865381.1 putative nucleotidyltransferase [Heliomicrobium gestii]MZP41641.1 nucleotidyltransferase domain-containing protein [Heliomicrobium gestii]